MVKNFRTLRLSAEFYHTVVALSCPVQLSDQLRRAASSISLNLAEGYGRATLKEQKYFFRVALGSLRECQAVLLLQGLENTASWELSDKLGAHLFCLIKNCRGGL